MIDKYDVWYNIYMCGFRGGGGGSGHPPPRDLSEVGSCMDVWSKGEGPKVSYYHYFLTRFARSPAACLKVGVTSQRIWLYDKARKLRILCLDIWETFSMFIVDLNADIRGGFNKSRSRLSKITTGYRCRNIRNPRWPCLHVGKVGKSVALIL